MSSGVIKTLCSFSRMTVFSPLPYTKQNCQILHCIYLIRVCACVCYRRAGGCACVHTSRGHLACPIQMSSCHPLLLCIIHCLEWKGLSLQNWKSAVEQPFQWFLTAPPEYSTKNLSNHLTDESKKKERLIRRQWAWPHSDQDCLGSVYILGPLVKLWSYLKDPKDGVQGFAGSICFPQHLLNVST